jgi:hypothetical protein
MNDYPKSIHQLDLDSVVISPEIIAAVRHFASAKPYRGSIPERVEKFRTLINDVCEAAGVEPPDLHFSFDESQSSGGSFYCPATKQIVLIGMPSVITTLHEVCHYLNGPSEHVACAWSLRLFRECFPNSFTRLKFSGHMAIKKRDQP